VLHRETLVLTAVTVDGEPVSFGEGWILPEGPSSAPSWRPWRRILRVAYRLGGHVLAGSDLTFSWRYTWSWIAAEEDGDAPFWRGALRGCSPTEAGLADGTLHDLRARTKDGRSLESPVRVTSHALESGDLELRLVGMSPLGIEGRCRPSTSESTEPEMRSRMREQLKRQRRR